MLSWLLATSAIIAILVMTGAFVAARRRHRLDTVDIAWGLVFACIAAASLGFEVNWRTGLIALLVYVWSVRLMTHLLDRSRRTVEDPRYAQMSKQWKGSLWQQAYIRIFLLQAVLAWLVSLPVAFATGKGTQYAVLFAVLGSIVWLQGYVVELIADRQLAAFKRDSKNLDAVLQTGLWRYSRHPNYYGEISQWLGIGLIACGAHNGWMGLAGPLVLTYLIIFVSGIPPIEKRKANDLAYQEYKQHTSALIPWRSKS